MSDIEEVYEPKAEGEKDFVKKHVTIKHKDRNGNGDDVFKGNTKYIKRKEERHGYDPGEDEKVYEETEKVDESFVKRLSPSNKNYNKRANIKSNSKLDKEVDEKLKDIDASLSKKSVKESVIDNAINTFITPKLKEQNYPLSLEEKLESKIEGLSEIKKNSVRDLFSSLNEDNKTSMLKVLDEEKGLNKVLDFIISNGSK